MRLESLESRYVLDSTVVFNEVMYHPEGPGNPGEWLELHNQMAIDMDLSNWRLDSGVDYTFPAGTVIRAGGYRIVAADPLTLAAATGLTDVLGPWTGSLSNGGERVALFSNHDRLMDALDYRDDGDWPVGADGGGASLAKHHPDAASDSSSNWRTSLEVGGTPGAENFPDGPRLGDTTQLISIDATWRFDDSGADLGTAWRGVGFDDSSWASGNGLLFADDSDLPGPKNTAIDPHAPTVYVRGTFDFQGDPTATQLSLGHVLDDGAVFYLNGTEVYRFNMPAGAVNAATQANSLIGTATAIDDILLPPDALVVGSNLLAIELHQRNTAATFELVQVGPPDTPVPDNLATDPGAFPFAKDVFQNGASDRHQIDHLNNGLYGNGESWIGNSANGFAGVAFSGAATIDRIAWGRSNVTGGDPCGGGVCTDRSLDTYTVQYTTVANPDAATPDGNWTTIGQVTYDGATPTPHLRHLYQFPAVENVTGVRIRIVNTTTAIDEIEVYAPAPPDAVFGATFAATEVLPDPPPIVLSEVSGTVGQSFFIELHNPDDAPVSIDGFVLASSTGSRFVLPPQILGPGQYLAVDQNDWPFQDTDGDRIFLFNADESLLLDAVSLKDSLQGRSDQHDGRWQTPLTATPNAANVFSFRDEIVINEIMYHPRTTVTQPDAIEFIELVNRSSAPVDLAGWRLDDAISLTFPSGTVIAANDFLVVSNDYVGAESLYPATDFVPVNYAGMLSNRSERIQLLDNIGNLADEVTYYDSGRWSVLADGGGTSLELIDSRADNDVPESWQSSDEAGTWNTYTYRAVATSDNSTEMYHEFILGLLDQGIVLVDDISVIEDPDGSAVPLLQNGTFETDNLGLTPASWRINGDHRGTVVLDPDNPLQHVLRLEADGPAEDRFNHAETTFLGNAAIQNGMEYELSFRAKWLAGSNQLHSRFFFNRMPRTTLLDVPAATGTPGLPNTRQIANSGPTFQNLRQFPPLPDPAEDVVVSVDIADPDAVSSATLWYSVDGGVWESQSLSHVSADTYAAAIPGQSAGRLIQFYVEAQDGMGMSTTFPAGGGASRALIRVQDGQAATRDIHNFRILMTPADTALLHTPTNRLSNATLPATVIYNESEIFYDVGVSLRGSNAGRSDNNHVSFYISFDPTQLFRGVHSSAVLDRSGRGATAPFSQDELLIKHLANVSGDIPSMYDDLVHVIAPNPIHSRTALLMMERYSNDYLDSQFANGSEGNLFKLELFYVPLNTTDGNPESPKLPSPYFHPPSKELEDLGSDKEAYRQHL